mgnify:CR=1 FL=1|tara:strand:+ start:38150 stop:38389 length:240 start_codon:yes stop_codon:yes gene_type:complete
MQQIIEADPHDFGESALGEHAPSWRCTERRDPEGGYRFGKIWCGREDSNFHGLSPTTTSTLRVYQFRHDRIQGEGQAVN